MPRFVTDCEFPTPLCTTAREHFPSIFRRHTKTKAVLVFSFPYAGLKCSFHDSQNYELFNRTSNVRRFCYQKQPQLSFGCATNLFAPSCDRPFFPKIIPLISEEETSKCHNVVRGPYRPMHSGLLQPLPDQRFTARLDHTRTNEEPF
jgi:hypothetical protein